MIFGLIEYIILSLGASYLFSLINSNPWLWFAWVPAGFVSVYLGLIIYYFFIYMSIAGCFSINNKFKIWYQNHVLNVVCVLLGIWVKVEGKENLLKQKNVLFVSNHKSLLDPIIVFKAIRYQCCVAAKSDVWHDMPYLKPTLRNFRCLCIDRNNDRASAKEIIRGIKYLQEGIGVIIFPEGGIKTREVGQMVSIKPGAYKLAEKSNSPIQPMAIIGNQYIDKRKLVIFPMKKIVVKILPAIMPEDYKDLNTHDIALKVTEVVNEQFTDEERIHVEIQE